MQPTIEAGVIHEEKGGFAVGGGLGHGRPVMFDTVVPIAEPGLGLRVVEIIDNTGANVEAAGLKNILRFAVAIIANVIHGHIIELKVALDIIVAGYAGRAPTTHTAAVAQGRG